MPQEFLLPAGVREKNGSYHLVIRHQWRKLCRISEGRAALYGALAEKVDGSGTVWYAILQYLARGMSPLAPATQRNYRQAAGRMLHHMGHLWLREVEPTHFAQFLKWCRENTSALTGNRDKAFMSSVFEFAMAEGWCASNPCRGVRRNTETSNARYVEHTELVTALDRAPPELYALMGIAYLLGIRQTDLREARHFQDTGSILKVIESKTGKVNEHEITATVRVLLTKAAEHREAVAVRYEQAAQQLERLSQAHRAEMRRARAAQVRAQPFIFLSQRGLAWSEWGLQSALRRFEAGFQFRQLRPKAETDKPGTLGHVGQMQVRYTKKRRLAAVK